MTFLPDDQDNSPGEYSPDRIDSSAGYRDPQRVDTLSEQDAFLAAMFGSSADYDWTDDDIAAMSLSGCISYIVLTLSWLVFYLGNVDLVGVMNEGEGERAAWALIGVMVASATALLSSAYFFAVKKHPNRWKSVGLRPTTRAWLVGAVLIGVVFFPLNIFFTIVVQHMLDIPPVDFSSGGADRPFPIAEFLAVLFLAAVIVPVVEEIFFRGIIYKWLRRRAGFLMGLLVSSVAFGGLHASASMPAISILGVFCALAYEFSNSLWPAVMIHATNNALAIIISYIFFSSPLIV